MAKWLAIPVLAAGALAACGGDGPGTVRRSVSASCDTIGQIQSYRYQVRLKLQSPAFESSGGATPAPPLSTFADALNALFSDMKLDGAYVAPDRTQVILTFQNEELELRTIGEMSWVRVGEEWQEQDASEDLSLLTPDIVCEDVVKDLAPSLADVEPVEETVNGIVTEHYRLDQADIKRLPELLGTDRETPLPESFQVDAWLALDGGWPVRLNIAAEETDESGKPASIELFMEFRDINDPGISIQPPQGAVPQLQ